MICQQTWREFSHLVLWVAIFMYYREMLVKFIYAAPRICQWAEPCHPQHRPRAVAAESSSHHPAEVLLTGGKCKGAFATLCMELITLWASQTNGDRIDVLGRVCREHGNGCREARLHLVSPSSNAWSFLPVPFRPEPLWHMSLKASQEEM